MPSTLTERGLAVCDPREERVAVPDDAPEVEMGAGWEIETDMLRARVRRRRTSGAFRLYHVRRCTHRWAARGIEEWVGFWQCDAPFTRPTEQHLRALAARLDRKARRLYQLGRQQEAQAQQDILARKTDEPDAQVQTETRRTNGRLTHHHAIGDSSSPQQA